MEKNIEQLTGIAADERSQMIYNVGLAYLAHQCHGYPYVADEISASRTFWRWWMEHWNRRDREFIETLTRVINNGQLTEMQTIRTLYFNQHDPIALSCELSINGHVLQDSYASMMGKINDELITAYHD